MNPVLAVVSSVTAVAIFPAVAEARVPVSTVVDQIEIEILGPPSSHGLRRGQMGR